MADIVTTAIQANGFRNAVVMLTNESDATGETAVLKVDAGASGPYGVAAYGRNWYPGTHLTIWKVQYTIREMGVRLLWDADTDVDALVLAPGTDDLDFSMVGGLRVPAGLTGATGSIRLTTVEAAAGDSYSILLELKKNILFR